MDGDLSFVLHLSMEIKQAATKEDFMNCFEVVKELRPHLHLDEYLDMALHMMDEGYKMIFTEVDGKAVSFCGYRYETMFHRGKSIYIDDLCSLPVARGKGHAGTLIDYVINEAREAGCKSVHLDSGHHRHDAHRLYLNKRFKITAHHFALEL